MGQKAFRPSPTCRRRSTWSTSCCHSSTSRMPSSNASPPAPARPASSQLVSRRRVRRGAPTRSGCAEIASEVRPATGRPQHHRHGQYRGRHDGELREFPALAERRRIVLHPDRHLHRCGHAERYECRDAAPAGGQEHRRRQQDRRRRSRFPRLRRKRPGNQGGRALYREHPQPARVPGPAPARCASSKPIVLLKPGRTPAGARASASHTGSLASDDEILDGALRQYGIARAEDEDDFLNALRALAMLPKPRGRRVGSPPPVARLASSQPTFWSTSGLELAALEPETLAACARPARLAGAGEPVRLLDRHRRQGTARSA